MHRAVKIPNVTITLRFCVPGNQEFSLLNTHQVRSDKSLNRKPFMTAAARFFTGCMALYAFSYAKATVSKHQRIVYF